MRILFGQLRKHLGDVFHDLARQKESKILEGPLQEDHIYMLISIPPKVCSFSGGWLYKGQKRNSYSSQLPRPKKYVGMSFGHGVILFQLWY
jgi:putative transposase